MKGFLLAAFAFVLSGCPVEECDKGETRCSETGNRVELCSSSGEWETMMDCDDIEGGATAWVCCPDPVESGYNCLPPDECGGDK